MKKIAIIVLGLVLAAAACNKTNTTTPNNGSNPDTTSTTVTIKVSATGFDPSSVTIKKGTTVIFESVDTPAHWPASDPHPAHTGLPGLDALRGLTKGQTYSYTFMKAGKWGVHDHLNAASKGFITVTE